MVIAGCIIRRKVDETPAFPRLPVAAHGELPQAPIIQAIKESWQDRLRVIVMALMNTIAAPRRSSAGRSRQPSYGVGMSTTKYLWIPVLGNFVAVLVIPFVGNLSDKVGRKPVFIVGALSSGAT